MYIRSEKDVRKVVNALIANTKGDGEKSEGGFLGKSGTPVVLRADRIDCIDRVKSCSSFHKKGFIRGGIKHKTGFSDYFVFYAFLRWC